MFILMIQGILETQGNFILAAAVVCLMTAATLVLLTRNVGVATTRQRAIGAVWVAIVAGVGV